MRKNVLIPIVLILSLLFSGCMLTPFSTDAAGDPYDTTFKSAHEFAEYWMGPCEETGEREVNSTVVHEMRDSELGFTYTVDEMYVSSGGGHVMYTSSDFGHYYLKAFLEKTDIVSKLENKGLGLTVKVKDLRISKDTGLIIAGTPELDIITDEKLTDDDAKEIANEVRDALRGFDVREYFTKSDKTSSACIQIRCAPWSEDAGKKFHNWISYYGNENP